MQRRVPAMKSVSHILPTIVTIAPLSVMAMTHNRRKHLKIYIDLLLYCYIVSPKFPVLFVLDPALLSSLRTPRHIYMVSAMG